MIKIEQIAAIIQARLNTVATNQNALFQFALTSVADEFVPSTSLPTINGLVTGEATTIVPVSGLNAYYETLMLRIPCKWEYRKTLYNLLVSAVSAFRGVNSTEVDSDNVAFACITNCGMPNTSEAKIQQSTGKSVDFEMTFFFNFVEGGVLSNACVWTLQSQNLVELDGSTARMRIPQTDNVANAVEMQTVISQQGLQHNFTIPYLNNELCRELVQDIMSGALDKTYMLTYSDGIAFTATSPKSWTVVMKTGTLNREAGKIVSIGLEFLIARSDL